jgi:lipopolysaccharide export system protein LptA
MNRLIPSAALAALLLAAPAQAQLSSNSDAPVEYAADTMEVFNTQCRWVLQGRAEMLQADARLRAETIRMFRETKPGRPGGADGGGCGELSRAEAETNVYYVTPGRRVRGDTAVYDAVAETIVVSGDVVAIEGENVLSGSRMTINLKTGQGNLVGGAKGLGETGRPRGVFYPKARTGAAQ